MQFSWDFNTATLLAVGANFVFAVVFMVRSDGRARNAQAIAVEARKMASDAHDKIAALHGIVSLHKEQIARDYIDKEALRDMERRLSDDINRLGDRIDEALDRRK